MRSEQLQGVGLLKQLARKTYEILCAIAVVVAGYFCWRWVLTDPGRKNPCRNKRLFILSPRVEHYRQDGGDGKNLENLGTASHRHGATATM
jgi:hypothetical protein